MKLNLSEVAIALLLENNNPNLLAADFLKDANVVPADWQPVAPPIIDRSFFTSGVSITAQPNRLVFSQDINSQQPIWISELAKRYIYTLSMANYQGVVNSFQGHLEFPNNLTGARDFMFDRFLAGQGWQDFLPIETSVRLSYQIADAQLGLNIREAIIAIAQSPDDDRTEIPVVVFSGDFIRSIDPDIPPDRRAENIVMLTNKLEEDARIFTNIVEQKFIEELGKSRSPMVAPYFPTDSKTSPFKLGGEFM